MDIKQACEKIDALTTQAEQLIEDRPDQSSDQALVNAVRSVTCALLALRLDLSLGLDVTTTN